MSQFYIASVKHTSKADAHITFWGRFHRGYTPVIGTYIGRYCFGEARSLNDGLDCIAIPAKVVDAMLQPEPYFRNYKGEAAKFYDQHGPVIENTRENWATLIAESLKQGRQIKKVKPEVFRGKKRCFSLPAAAINPTGGTTP